MRLQSLLCHRSAASSPNADAALQVNTSSDRLQVGRINATADAAKMVKVESIGDFSNERLVADSMGSLIDIGFNSQFSDDSVSLSVCSGSPQPASGILINLDSVKYSLLWIWRRYLVISHVISLQVASVRAAWCGNIIAARFYFITPRRA